jgi:hypothetical protein
MATKQQPQNMEAKVNGKDANKSAALSENSRPTGLHKQLRKTKFCMYHLQGACRFGSECAFAHSLNEMHNTPDLRKTQLCKAYLEGRCNGDCNFAHTENELRSTDVFFKKTLCIWNEKGKCRNGAQCRFAHGIKELRSDGMEMDAAAFVKSQLGEGALWPQKAHATQKGTKLDKAYKSEKMAFAALSQVSGDEPIKVHPRGSAPQKVPNMSPLMPRLPPQQQQIDPALGEVLEALQGQFRHAAAQVAQQKAAVQENLLQSSTRSALQMDLDDLRQSVAVLTSCCSRLQERVESGKGPAGVTPSIAAGLNPQIAGAFGSLSYTGQYDPQILARLANFDGSTGGLQYDPRDLARELATLTSGQYGAGDFMRAASSGREPQFGDYMRMASQEADLSLLSQDLQDFHCSL